MSRPTPYDIAMDLLATRYQGSALAFVAGSFRRHEFAESWIHAFESAYAGESQALLDLTSQVLDKYGGLFFDGYRREASSDWRKTLPKNKDLATDIEYSQKISKNREGIVFEESILNHGILGPVTVRAA